MLHFYKMQGLGNDYVYINCFENDIEKTVDDLAALSVRLSNRNFGVGSDGIILLCPSKVADLKMRIFNADGSEAKMCGNGIRCVGKLAYDLLICRHETMTVETLSGIKFLKLTVVDGIAVSVQVDMGSPSFEVEKIPVIHSERRMVNTPVIIGGIHYNVTCVSIGNPHAVIFTRGIEDLPLAEIGPLFEKDKMFPEGVNTEFAEIIDQFNIKMRVWERGSGETMACGTGACATVAAACINRLCPRGSEINVHLLGGELKITWDNDRVWMTGPAQLVFTGDIEI